jgi:hypothetical protein
MLTTQMGQLAQEVAELKKGKGQLPSDTKVNPTHTSSKNVHINQLSVIENGKGGLDGSVGKELIVPFPSALFDTGNKSVISRNPVRQGKVWEKVSSVKVNVPLVEKVKQIPTNLNALKNLINNKQKVKTPKQVSLTSQVSANVVGNKPIKLQDPGAPLIDIEVGNFKISNVLLDLGAGGNILPGTLYDQHDFGPLHRVDTEVVLPDTSCKKPRGLLKDVIIKVQDFFYPVDFLVVDYEKRGNEHKPNVILGRPFLNTSHAIIDCHCGTVDIRFGEKRARLKVSTKIANPLPCEYDLDAGLMAKMKELFVGWMKELEAG